jgi:hypothetical protein
MTGDADETQHSYAGDRLRCRQLSIVWCAESALFRCQLGCSSMRDRWRPVSSASVVRSGRGRLSDYLADGNAYGGVVE